MILGSSFIEYFENLSWYSLIDLIVFIGIAIVLFMFFNKHRALKIAVLFSAFMLVYVLVFISNAIIESKPFELTLRIFDFITIFLMIGVLVVYQNDFKVLFAKLARGNDKVYNINATDEALITAAREMAVACQNMAKNKVGALIIIIRTTVPDRILDTGTELDAVISSGLLESIFSTKGPLHDGAVVVKGNKILSAGCFLPLSKEVDIAKELGTRHRAAIGITEESDVVAIVCSEETGVISVVQNGKILRYLTHEKLLEEIKAAYNVTNVQKTAYKSKRDRKFI